MSLELPAFVNIKVAETVRVNTETGEVSGRA